MKSGIIKRNGKCFVQLPDEFMQTDEIELFQLKEGHYLLSFPLGTQNEAKQTNKTNEILVKKQDEQPTEKEIELLKKLLAVRFENRTPKYVAQFFTDIEKKSLEEMEKKGYISVFKGGKYKETGVYNIHDNIYPKLRETAPAQKAAPVATQPNQSAMDALFKQGHTVIQSNQEAYYFSDMLRKNNKNGDVMGIKSFDGKYYVVTKKYLTEMTYCIKNTLKEDMSVAEIARVCKTEEVGCRAALLLMAETGEVIEKRKDIFSLA